MIERLPILKFEHKSAKKQKNIKVHIKYQRPQVAKTILNNKLKLAECVILADFKLYHRDITLKVSLYFYKNIFICQ